MNLAKHRWPWVLVVASALGCPNKDADGDDAPPTTPPTEDTSATVPADTGDTGAPAPTGTVTATAAASANIEAVFRVEATSTVAGEAWVEFGLDGALDRRTPSYAPNTSFSIPMIGLKEGRAYTWRVVVDTEAGPIASETQALLVPSAPAAIAGTALAMSTPDANIPYVLFSIVGAAGSYAAIVDIDGDLVWWHAAQRRNILFTPELARDGQSFLWGEYDSGKTLDIGRMYRVRVDGSEITSTRMLLSHHAAIEKPNGDIGWLGLDFRDVDVGGTVLRMATDRIYETPEGAADATPPTELFNTFDDHGGPPVLTCEHMTGDFDRFDEVDILEWTHGNSLAYVDEENAYYLNAKQTDWLLKIDGDTGELLWQLNGVGGDFTLPSGEPVWTSADEPTLFSHAHMSQVWKGGMVTFDNGDHRVPRISSAAELAWDETTMTAERVWEFFHPGGGSTYPLGDVRKLDDGSYLIGWGQLAEITHVSQDKRVLWQATVPEGYTLGRVRPLFDLYDVRP